MGFYGPEPFTNATATYLWLGLGSPGVFIVEVSGDAPNYTSGITLVRDPDWVGGLKVNVMGWTGPLGKGTTPYKVSGTFPGQFVSKIVISGSNGQKVIDVKEIAHDKVDDFVKKAAGGK
jgi:hypothetical protein